MEIANLYIINIENKNRYHQTLLENSVMIISPLKSHHTSHLFIDEVLTPLLHNMLLSAVATLS